MIRPRSGAPALEVVPARRRAEIVPVWNQIEAELGSRCLANSWAWTSTWLDHYGDLVPHRFVIARCDGRPVGAALLTSGRCVRRGPVTLRSVHLGTAGEPYGETVRVEYNRLLVEPAFLPGFAEAIVREAAAIAGDRPQLLVLDGVVPEDAAAFQAADPRFAMVEQPTFITDLTALREARLPVLEGLKRTTRAKIRKTNRLLEELHGPIRVEWAESLEEAFAIFAELRELHARRWAHEGQPGVFASVRFTGFHLDLIRRWFPEGKVVLARVMAGDHTVGCDYCFVENGRVLGQQWGLALFEDSRMSTGLAVGAAVTRVELERGYAEKDWMAGDVLYKRELSTTRRSLVWATLPFGPALPTLDVAARVKHALHGKLTRHIDHVFAGAR